MQLGSFSLNIGIGYDNTYLAELSSASGDVLWLKGFGGGAGHTIISDLAIDELGNAYFSGGFSGSANFLGTTIYSHGEYDFFIAKLDGQQNLS